ncbi:MAG: phosphotransferase family protein [Vicinamibacterales bacterium]
MRRDTADARADDGIDRAALARYLRWHLAGHDIPGLQLDADIRVQPCGGALQPRTHLIRVGGAEFILRLRSTASALPHEDVAREFRWLSLLHPIFPLAPRPLLLCDDDAVLGRPFFLMERRRGIAVRAQEPMALAGHREARRQFSEAVVDTLVALHAVAIDESLAALDTPVGFVDRQVREWTTRWHSVRTEDVGDMDAVALWLTAHQPAEALEPAVVHGHFTLENLLLNPLEPAEITAVLDWKLAALGDPLTDVGALLAQWLPIVDDAGHDLRRSVTGSDGYLTRDALIQRYAAQSGRDLSEIDYYEVIALFRLAVGALQALPTAGADVEVWQRQRSARVRGFARRARALIG